MALTLDGIVPNMGMGSSSGLGVGAGALGGGVAGLILGGLLANNGNGGLFGNGNNNNGSAATAVTTDIVLNPAFQSLQNQISNLSNTLNTGDIQDSISRVNDAISNVATAQASANFTTLNSINGLGRDLVTNIHQQDLTQLNSFNALSTTTLQGFNGLAMQNQNATNQIIAQGTANAMAMQQCCCEIKSTILADGNATRALINDTNMQALRDQLTAANNKVSNNDQSQYLLTTILQHLSPAPQRTVVV